MEGNISELIDAELRAKNPLDQVPLLEFTDAQTGETQSLTQSLAIIEFLEEAFPNTRNVLPADALERARARQVRVVSVEHILIFPAFTFIMSSSPDLDCRDC